MWKAVDPRFTGGRPDLWDKRAVAWPSKQGTQRLENPRKE